MDDTRLYYVVLVPRTDKSCECVSGAFNTRYMARKYAREFYADRPFKVKAITAKEALDDWGIEHLDTY